MTAIRIGGADRTASKRFIAPDDDNPNDETVMSVPLEQPIEPGGTATIEIAWTAHVPRTFARTGAIGNFFFIAQWFPKLGVLQDAGWNCHQFHSGTEFFSDYGVYDVSLTVPAGWPLGATGVQRERRDNADGTTTHRYHQDDVHDFAWTTSPEYLERTARFEHPTLPPVEMRLLLQPEHAAQAERHFDATRTTLRYTANGTGLSVRTHHDCRSGVPERVGRHGISDAVHGGHALAGARRRHHAGRRHGPRGRPPVLVRHRRQQRVRGCVDGRRVQHVLDGARDRAGATTRIILRSATSADSCRGSFKDIALSRETEGNRLAGYRRDAKSDAQSTPTYRYFPSSGGNITYNKTALWLNTLERWLGWPTLQRVMSAHFSTWKFKHPSPADFFTIANGVSGQDLGWFFDQTYRSSNVFDYGVQDLKSTHDDGSVPDDRRRAAVR